MTGAIRPNGVLFEALPESGVVPVSIDPKGQLAITLPNRTVLPPAIMQALHSQAQRLMFPSHGPVTLRDVGWIANLCADADEYRAALLALDETAGSDLPVYNHPRAVALSRRDHVSRRLEGIAHLSVPKCVRFIAEEIDDFETTFKREGFSYPVLVRPAASQTGKGLIRIDRPQDWAQLHKTLWFSVPHYMTQFVDAMRSDGLWHKARAVYANGEVFLRHVLPGREWLVHAHDRTPSDCDVELGVLQDPRRWEALRQVCLDIHKRLPLDFFGVDLGWKSDTEIVLYEANAAMSILSYDHMPTYRRTEYEQNYKAIEQAVCASFIGFAQTQGDKCSKLPSVASLL